MATFLTEKPKQTIGRRVPPRFSKATGGPMPGIELPDLLTLQEIDDVDYIRRISNFK